MRSGGRSNVPHNFEVAIGVNGLLRRVLLPDVIGMSLLSLLVIYNRKKCPFSVKILKHSDVLFFPFKFSDSLNSLQRTC